MNQQNTVSITTQRGIFIFYLVVFAYAVGSSAYTLFTTEQSVWRVLWNILVIIMSGVVARYMYQRLRDKRVHIRLDEHGIYLRETVRKQNGVRATVNDLNLAWQDIERCELRFRIFNIGEMLDFHTADGACYRVDILEYGIWRTRKLARKIQALHQAAPEQRARLLAEFQAA